MNDGPLTVESADPPFDAGAQLAALQAARARLASAADCPPARHWVFGGLFGGVVAAQAASGIGPFLIEAALMLVVLGVYAVDRARKGVWLNGYRAGATRKVTFGLLGVFLVIYTASVAAKWGLHLAWAPLLGGAVMVPVGYLASRAWSRTYGAEMERAP